MESIQGGEWRKQAWSRPANDRSYREAVVVKPFCVPFCARWDTLIRMASVHWSMLHWGAMQKSSPSCWARTGEQRFWVTRSSSSSIPTIRTRLRKHRLFSRRSQLQPAWDTHRHVSAQSKNRYFRGWYLDFSYVEHIVCPYLVVELLAIWFGSTFWI